MHPTARINNALITVNSGRVTVGAYTFAGFGVRLLTGSHEYKVARGAQRMAAIPSHGRDINIGQGVWLATGCTVIGPSNIGDDAVIAAGAVVVGNVPSGTVVAGVPARIIAWVATPN